MILRPYQAKLISDIRAQFASGARAVLAVAPTRSGKTVVFSEIARLATAKNSRVGIIVHRDSLLTQASDKLKECGVKHGIIAPGHGYYGDTVNVCSIMTLIRRLDRHDFDLLIYDECHHSVSASALRLLAHYSKARVLGVTATPIRADGRGLDSVYQKMVLGPSIRELIDDGYLTEPETYGPIHKLDLSGVKTTAGDYNRHDLALHMDTPRITGDSVSEYARICPGAPAVVFAVNIRHGADVAAAFSAAGFRTALIHGKMKLATIRAGIAGLSNGTVQVLVTIDLVAEGTDIKSIVCVINLRPTRSLGRHIQGDARGLTPMYAPGYPLDTRAGRLAAIAAGPKPRAVIIDSAGNCFRHMTVDETHTWTLAGRKRRGGKSGPTMSLTQCPKCLRPHKPAPECPHCGHIYEGGSQRKLNEVAGTLEKVDKVALRRAKWGEEHSCKTLEELVELGKARKYRYAKLWAERRWQYVRKGEREL